jgi:competence protein ComEC
MQLIQRVRLLNSKKAYLQLFGITLFLLTISLGLEYYNYQQFTKKSSILVQAKLLKQYTKTKIKQDGSQKSYQVLKLKSHDGLLFYTIAPSNTPNYKNKMLLLRLYTKNITFFSYLKGFFAYTKILQSYSLNGLNSKIAKEIAKQHKSQIANSIYQALFLAKQLPYRLQKQFSNLGISHLFAISGFHLGILTTLLFFLLKKPYTLLQQHYFPYRNNSRDLFFLVAIFSFFYLILLDAPPSLIRAFVMFVVTFLLYDRGVALISMETLLISLLLIIALLPRLLFSLGLWLSFLGVFYIFLFFFLFQKKSKLYYFFLLPIWVYFMMLPYSLILFGNFSIYHPLSIIITSLFILFYPLMLLAHFLQIGSLCDLFLQKIATLNTQSQNIQLPIIVGIIELLLSFILLQKRTLWPILLSFTLSVFIYAIYNITKL